ncbi:MAG: DUF3379 family protein, partial [Proteobacteria bacterium]|nr:DUF3379 family protein [Pseudomonadota bacterium]
MNCLEFRQLKLSDPDCISEEASLHRSGCPECARFEREIHELDASVHMALTVAVPEGFAAKVLLNQSLQAHPRRPKRWYWMSMAANPSGTATVNAMCTEASSSCTSRSNLAHSG